MKKTVLIAGAFIVSTMFGYAQEQESSAASSNGEMLKTKKGQEILPREGDIALGFNTVPMIDFLLNSLRYVSVFGGNAGTSSNTAFNAIQYTENANNQIVGKYYLDAQTAVRVRFGYNTLAGAVINPVQDALAMAAAVNGTQDDIDAASLILVDDKIQFRKKNISLAVGYEKRRGYGRLQGFYGGELRYNKARVKEAVEYGNIFSSDHEVEYTSNFNSGATSSLNPSTSNDRSRLLEAKYRSDFGIGVRGFIGAEYFFLPKMSVAVEYGFGWAYAFQNKEETKYETYHNGQNGPVVLIEEFNDDSSSQNQGFSVDNNNGQVNALNSALGGSNTLNGGSGSITLLLHF